MVKRQVQIKKSDGRVYNEIRNLILKRFYYHSGKR